MVSPHHHMALSLRSPQHLAVRPLTEAAHQATGAHCFLQATSPPGLPASVAATQRHMLG
jgi:hypothetical protein